MQVVLTTVAEAAARAVGFVRRCRKWTGALFVQTPVLGWLGTPQASLSELTQVAAKRGAGVSPQGLAQRFGEPAARLLERVLSAAIEQVIAAEPVAVPLLRRFTGVVVLDSSAVALPDGPAAWWQGCGGRVAQGTRAALKLAVRLDLGSGRLDGPMIAAGRTQDRACALQHAALPAGALRLADLGFWRLGVFRRIGEAGAHRLSRLNLQVAVVAQDGGRLDLPAWLAARDGMRLDVPVAPGAGERLPARLLGVRVPTAVAAERRRKRRAAARREGQTPPKTRLALADWTLLVTNAPAERLGVPEALVLARARWQIELLCKLWKQHGQLDESRSRDQWRVLCEVYAKLVAMVVQHWILLVGCWLFADRSRVEAAATVRTEATCLVGAIARHARLVEALRDIRRCLTAGCQVGRRRRKPSTFQLLLDPALGGLC
jgi:hypothetical protein